MSVRAACVAVGFVNPEIVNMMVALAVKFPDVTLTYKMGGNVEKVAIPVASDGEMNATLAAMPTNETKLGI